MFDRYRQYGFAQYIIKIANAHVAHVCDYKAYQCLQTRNDMLVSFKHVLPQLQITRYMYILRYAIIYHILCARCIIQIANAYIAHLLIIKHVRPATLNYVFINCKCCARVLPACASAIAH